MSSIEQPWYRGIDLHQRGAHDQHHRRDNDGGGDHADTFNIQIDREHYKILHAQMTGAELRQVPSTPIPPERDLFEVVPGHPDRKIENDDVVEFRNCLLIRLSPGYPGVHPSAEFENRWPNDAPSTPSGSSNHRLILSTTADPG